MKTNIAILAGAVLLLGSTAHAQNLLTNGDFNAGLTGWSSSAGNISTHTVPAPFGEVVEVGVGNFATTFFQTFNLATPGSLSVSFNLGMYRDVTNGFGVSSGPWLLDVSLEDVGATTVWSTTVDAFNGAQSGIYTPELLFSQSTGGLAAGDYTLRFAPQAHGWTLLDNVSVTASAPEPGTLVLLGLGGLCLARRCWPR
jgi:hypothetical protein